MVNLNLIKNKKVSTSNCPRGPQGPRRRWALAILARPAADRGGPDRCSAGGVERAEEPALEDRAPRQGALESAKQRLNGLPSICGSENARDDVGVGHEKPSGVIVCRPYVARGSICRKHAHRVIANELQARLEQHLTT